MQCFRFSYIFLRNRSPGFFEGSSSVRLVSYLPHRECHGSQSRQEDTQRFKAVSTPESGSIDNSPVAMGMTLVSIHADDEMDKEHRRDYEVIVKRGPNPIALIATTVPAKWIARSMAVPMPIDGCGGHEDIGLGCPSTRPSAPWPTRATLPRHSPLPRSARTRISARSGPC